MTQSGRDTSESALEFVPCWAELLQKWGDFWRSLSFHRHGRKCPLQLIQYLLKSFLYFISKELEVTSTIWVYFLDFRLLFICRKDILYEIKLFNINLKQSASFLFCFALSFLHTSSFSKWEKNCFHSGELFWQLTELNKTGIYITWTKCFKLSCFICWHVTLPMCLLC